MVNNFIHTNQNDLLCRCELEILTFPVRTEGNSVSNLLLSPNLQTQIFKRLYNMVQKYRSLFLPCKKKYHALVNHYI